MLKLAYIVLYNKVILPEIMHGMEAYLKYHLCSYQATTSMNCILSYNIIYIGSSSPSGWPPWSLLANSIVGFTWGHTNNGELGDGKI